MKFPKALTVITCIRINKQYWCLDATKLQLNQFSIVQLWH